MTKFEVNNIEKATEELQNFSPENTDPNLTSGTNVDALEAKVELNAKFARLLKDELIKRLLETEQLKNELIHEGIEVVNMNVAIRDYNAYLLKMNIEEPGRA